MAPALKCLFVGILSASWLGFVALSLMLFFMPWHQWVAQLYYVLFPSIFLYVVGIVLAVYFFVSRLSKLAKAQEITLRKSNITPNDIRLDRHQQELSDLAAKYMMLFSITLISTVLIQIMGLAVNMHCGTRWALIAIDFTVNLHCIYLQFSWANGHYLKWCGCCDRKFRAIITKRAQKRIHKHCLEMMKKNSVSSESYSGCSSQGAVP